MEARVTGTGKTIAEALLNAREIAAQGFEVDPSLVRISGHSKAEPETMRMPPMAEGGCCAVMHWTVECICDVPIREEVKHGQDIQRDSRHRRGIRGSGDGRFERGAPQ